MNGGNCYIETETGDPKCDCNEGFVGDQCELGRFFFILNSRSLFTLSFNDGKCFIAIYVVQHTCIFIILEDKCMAIPCGDHGRCENVNNTCY